MQNKASPFYHTFFFRFLCGRQFGRLVQRIAGNGQKDVEEAIVAAEGEHYEVDTVDYPTVGSSALRDDGSVHNMIPILLGEHLNDQR